METFLILTLSIFSGFCAGVAFTISHMLDTYDCVRKSDVN